MSTEQHKWAVKEALSHTTEEDFLRNVLPHCTEEELELVLTHLVSQGLWKSVGKVLERGVSAKQHRWAVDQACQHAFYVDFVVYVLPWCRDEELEQVLSHQVSRGLWVTVGMVLERGVSATQHRWAVAEAAKHSKDDSFERLILPHCSEDDIVAVLPLLVANRKRESAKRLLSSMVLNTLHAWMKGEHDSRVQDSYFWKLMGSCRIEESMALGVTKLVSEVVTKAVVQIRMSQYCHQSQPHLNVNLADLVVCQSTLCESLMTVLLRTLCCVMCSDDMEYTDITEHTRQCVSDIYTKISDCIEDHTDVVQYGRLNVVKNKIKWTAVFTEIADTHKTDPLFVLHFLQGLNQYYAKRRGKNDDAILQVIFAVYPLFPQLQSTALRLMLSEKRWGIISQACLSHVWEHDRRQLFKAAVEQGQWDVVRQWADHAVHKDLRDLAMKAAFKEKQWMVYLLLADHGHTMHEHMHAMYIVAKCGDWDTVLQMVERGGDVTEVSNLLENWVTGNLRMKPKGDATGFLRRGEKLIRLRLRFEQNSAKSPKKSLERCMWGSVLFNILHRPTEEYFSQVLHKVIEEEEWHILMHLVRLGMNREERDWLFPEMVRQQQWGVCRKLLEIGVDIQLCLQALPELMDRNQWMLVARVMEYSVDDAVRCQVMQWAFQMREGALFWHCLTNMDNEDPLSMETRVKLFHQAISRDIWQAVKPLIEEKDRAIIQCRDMAFLEAIEQHLWDVVDHCQVLGADINMEDDNGETPLHREARKKEWKAIEEIVFREGKPNMLDKDGVSVLNRLIEDQQWDTGKFVIRYGANIHLPARWNEYLDYTHTPLQALIDQRQADVIQFTVLWCPEQRKGVNDRGETALHAVCDSDRWDVMEDLMLRRVDPLAVTRTGQTALVYAVLNTQCPNRMVAECCRLGFSFHQPPLIGGDQDSLLQNIIDTVVEMWHPVRRPRYLDSDYVRHRPARFYDCDFVWHRPRGDFDCVFMWRTVLASPLVSAVLRDLPVAILMLFESGCSSRTDLCTLSTQLLKLTDLNTPEGRRLRDEVLQQREWVQRMSVECSEDYYQQRYSTLTRIIKKNTAFLRQLVTTPRTLLSSCRLLILRYFHFRDKKRQRRLQHQLSVPLKNYLEFSDFCHPDYGQHLALSFHSSQGHDLSCDRLIFYETGHDDSSSVNTSDEEFSSEQRSEEFSSDDEFSFKRTSSDDSGDDD